MENKKIRVAISHGDINGIGYEILFKIFAEERILELFTPVIYGSGKAAAFWRNHLSLEAEPWHLIHHADEAKDGCVNLIDCAGEECHVEPGQPTGYAGQLALAALERATEDVKAGRCHVLVTAPINKSVMPRDRFPYNGHTQYLEAVAAKDAGKSLMLLSCLDCRVALATGHIPVSKIASVLTSELIAEKVRLLEAGLKRDFGIVKPRIAVLGLNPHAGDRGLMGNEEQTIITPAIEQLSSEGIIVFGPYPADGFWGGDRADAFDGILAMYHDQGLAPFKALYMSEGVNSTLGLTIVRTSPDHGTGYDIAGQGKASPDSMRAAIYQAIDIYRARSAYEYSRRNPLRRTYHHRGHDDEKLDLTTHEEDY